MDKTKVSVEARDHVLIMTLNRPEKLNAFDLDMYRDLGLAYGALHRNPDLRCGLITAEGEHFTSGLDLIAWAPYFGKAVFQSCPPMQSTRWAWTKTIVCVNQSSWRPWPRPD